MGVSWTIDQKAAIDQRDKNILISAAAGSGKTAVLVERILSIVTDPVKPVDVDRLLIVTFTRAAAAEMKDRIGKALEERLQLEPENEHLQKQSILLHHAQISTIHGFCTYVLQNYFHRIDLDPGYRIAEDGELEMIKREVLEEILEEEYASENENFLHFIDSFAPGKNDKAAEELILRLYEFAISSPDPEEWLDNCRSLYETDSEEELEQSEWLQNGIAEGRALLSDLKDSVLQNLELAKLEQGPYEYIPTLEADLEQVEKFINLTGYQELVEAFASLGFGRMSGKKMPGVLESLKKTVKDNRDAFKTALKKIGDDYFASPVSVILQELQDCRLNASELVRLTRRFMTEFIAKKRQGNILDFSDLEHLALQILLKKEDGTWVRTEVAKELSGQFHEIMIDEYQDSNFVQEALLQAVSGEEDGRFNRFMVGDVKQSIYGFRQAKPELFVEKYHAYGKDDTCCRIDLKQNFRSRAEVLDTVNALFRRLMVPALGKIEYDDAAALHLGAGYAEAPEGTCDTEVILIDRKDPDMSDLKIKEDRVEMEAMAVAMKMKEIMRTQQVYDAKKQVYRPASYRDFAILLRAATGRAEVFLRVLKNEGIPAFAVSKSGYFSTIEVGTVLNYLRICDNPRQDIPYTAVLRSPIVGLTDEELALLRCAVPDQPLYDAVPMLLKKEAEAALPLPAQLMEKLEAFWNRLEAFRDLVPCIPVHELVSRVLDQTGYRNLAASLPMGEQRLANLNLLVEKAVDFEATKYHGLFQFLQYIQQMEKNKIDFGEVNLYGESADAVCVMTTHKSKGLEYPFVFVSCLGDKFSMMDIKASVVFHSELGLGMDYIDPVTRVRRKTMLKRMVSERIRLEMLAEELRVLYVALTRAKEKLILTGLVSDLEKSVDACMQTPSLKDQPLPYGRLSKATGYLDWILPVISGCQGFQEVYKMFKGEDHPGVTIDAPVKVMVQTPGNLTMKKTEETIVRDVIHMEMKQIGADPDEVYDASLKEFLEKKSSWRYPWDYRNILPSVVSVSELKKNRPGQSDEDSYAQEPGIVADQTWRLKSMDEMGQREAKSGEKAEVGKKDDFAEYIPAFMREKEEKKTGAVRGTAYHRFLECLDYSRIPEPGTESLYPILETQLQELVDCGKMAQDEADCIFRKDIVIFLESEIGQRMRKAARRGKLFREQPFLLSMPSGEINHAWDFDERVLIRGVIDACFEEDGAYVIVDYKTDKVRTEDGSCLLNHYARQLQYYQTALEKGTSMPVKERFIYSVTLGKEVPVPAADPKK